MNSFPLFGGNKQGLLDDIAKAMQSIGYKGNLLVQDAEYNDVTNNKSAESKTGIVDLVGYAQIPTNYRNACIAVAISNNGGNPNLVANHRSVGAPLFFLINDANVTRWKVTGKGEPELKEIIQHSEIFTAFERNAKSWNPERIFRAKIEGEIEDTTQLDFFDIGLLPLLEGMIHKKLDKLLKEVLVKMANIYEEKHFSPDYQEIYRIIFRFIVAKVMKDRRHPITNQDNALVILKAIEDYYNPPKNVTIKSALEQKVIEVAWQAISGSFQFQNLSVDDLAFVYESSLVTDETRKIFGTHSTPPRIAEYVVRKLPIESIPEKDRYVLESCAGHGGFLISALRRLRDLLNPKVDTDIRHKYLVEHMSAIELDSFALEACWSRLVLADYPHRNGWKLHQGDIFKGNLLSNELQKARILFCNPPFEDFSFEERNYYKKVGTDILTRKPAQFLNQIMQSPPSLLGLVLPGSFESGASYLPFHKQLAETYDSIELVALPEVFNYSDATTMLILASGKREYHGAVSVVCRKVNEGEEKGNFLRGLEPAGAKVKFSAEDYLKPKFSLWQPPLTRIWKYLKQNSVLSEITEIHRGLCWVSQKNKSFEQRRELVLDEPKDGYMLGCAKVSGNFSQYYISANQYLSLNKQDQYDKAYELPWHTPKVVCNAARLRRSAWRLGAFADTKGLALSQRFLAIWVKNEFSLHSISALLNSPLANAFMYSMENERANHIRTLKSIPIPNISSLKIGGEIEKLSKKLQEQIERKDYYNASETLLRVDAEILREYDLPPNLERELLDLFQNISRPTPLEFNGYYPKGFTAHLPLYEVISPEFKEARNSSLFDRITMIDDEKISEAMAYIRGELLDENISS
jgi:N-6 DNA Methylase